MVKGLSSLKTQLTAKLLEEATKSARQGHYLDAAAKFGQSGARPGEQLLHANYLAYAFYRRALTHQSELDETRAIGDLETARQFPGLTRPLRSLIQQRLTTIQKGPDIEIRMFDKAIAEQFDRMPTDVELRGEFLRRFGLSQAKRNRSVEGIDEISSIGVYRWVGDTNRNEQWSQLIRKFKKGEFRATPMCKAWMREVDYIVPVPAVASRTTERGIDIVVRTGEHLSSRLGAPIRTDFLKRNDSSERSRFVSKIELASQYSFSQKNAEEIRGRTVMLLDDVINRGHTAGVCALRLREFGCNRVVLLVLAQAESSRHA